MKQFVLYIYQWTVIQSKASRKTRSLHFYETNSLSFEERFPASIIQDSLAFNTCLISFNIWIFISNYQLLDFEANLTTANSPPQISSFQCLWQWWPELFISVYCCQPETERCCIIVASSLAMAFDEWCCTEIFQARSWWVDVLSWTFTTNSGILKKKNKAKIGLEAKTMQYGCWNMKSLTMYTT